MSVQRDNNRIRLFDESKVEDAETLFALLQQEPLPDVDLREAARLHTAVVQVLLAARPPLAGPAADPFLAKWLPELAKWR